MVDDAEESGAARRRAARASVVLQLAYRSASHLLVSYCTNLSRGGLFVPSTEPMSAGTRLTLSLAVPGEPVPVELHAEVRWTRAFDAIEGPAGMGLAFDGIDEVLGNRIDDLVAHFQPLRVELVGDHIPTIAQVAAQVRMLVSCRTRERPLLTVESFEAELVGADLLVVEIGDDPAPALALLRRIAAHDPSPPRVALCDGRPEVRARAIALARVINTPIEPSELRRSVLESVTQVDAHRQLADDE
jgi:uncharacterized protein (TIGR02266 family)